MTQIEAQKMLPSYLLLLPVTLATPVANPDPIFVPFHQSSHLQHSPHQFISPLFGPGFPFSQGFHPPQHSKQPVLVIHTLVQSPDQKEFGGNQLQNPDSFDKSLFGALFHGENSLFGKIFGGGGIVPTNTLLVRRNPTFPSIPSIIPSYPKKSTKPTEEANKVLLEDESGEDDDIEKIVDCEDEVEDTEEGSASGTENSIHPNIELLQ